MVAIRTKSILTLTIMLTILIILGIGIKYCNSNTRYKAQLKATKTFINCLTEGDFNAAKQLASGRVLYNLSNAEITDEQKLFIVRQDYDIESCGSDWTVTRAKIETRDINGTVDVHWYKVYLTGSKDKWRVYQLEEADPVVKNSLLPVSIETGEAEEIFSNYLDALSNNNYEEAGKFLIGRAKKAHVQAENVLGRAPLINRVGKIKLTPLATGEDILIARADYEIEDRQVSVIVSFYYTSGGWRVYNVAQV